MKPVTVINKFRKDGIPEYQKKIACWAPFQAMHIDKKGRIKPCPFSLRGKEADKSVRWSPKKSILECWNDNIFEEMREYSIVGELHEHCKYCIQSCKDNKPASSLDYDWVGGERDLNHSHPRELELELSNTCNYMCDACSPWCSTQWVEKLGLKEDISFKSSFDNPAWREAFIEDLRTFIHKVYRINFTGGEPFAQRIVYDILNMIEEENPKNLIIHFTTNGSIMNSAVRRIVKKENTRFTVSLDSINPETYPTIRINGNLENVLSNIQYMLDNNSNKIGASFVITKKNVFELPTIVSWCNKKNIIFSYHILENMGFRDWDKDIKPISIECESKEYIMNIKTYLMGRMDNITWGTNTNNSEKNIRMYKQYVERLK